MRQLIAEELDRVAGGRMRGCRPNPCDMRPSPCCPVSSCSSSSSSSTSVSYSFSSSTSTSSSSSSSFSFSFSGSGTPPPPFGG